MTTLPTAVSTAAAASADVVHLEDIESAWSDLRVHVPSLLHVHYRSRLDRDLGQPWEPRFRHVAEFALAEWRGARRHHWLVANSPVVAATLRRDNPRAEVTVVPLSLDPADYPVATPPDGLVVGVIGTAGWATTRAAMERLVESVWPLVHAAVPQAVLRIAGRGTDQLRSAGSRVGIETVGEVASAAEFIRGLSLLLFPLTRGSGMKVKVLESLASGVPVVTTSRGAEGIAANDGMILAETDAALAASTIRLLTEEVERHQRAAAARATYERLYTPIVATSPLVALYERMAAGR